MVNDNEHFVYFHDDMDGIASAAIVRKACKELKSQLYLDGTSFAGRKVNYGDQSDIKEYADKHVIIVDFSFPEKDMMNIKDNATSLTWIDHHKSTKEKLYCLWIDKSIAGIRDDNSESACMLTWKYYFPELSAPLAIDYINDWDIWRFKFGVETKNFHEGLYNIVDSPQDEIWDVLLYCPEKHMGGNNEDVNRLAIKIYQIKQTGASLMSAKQHRVEKAFETGVEGTLHGYKTFFVNASCDISDIGNYIVEKGFDIAFIWKMDKDKIRVSLRSKPEVDVSHIAKGFGGGGHHSAAGFELNNERGRIFKLFGTIYDI